MTAHVFKSDHGQCECRWCGLAQGDVGECPVTEDMRMGLYRFARNNGRTWKAMLIKCWTRGYAINAELITLRGVVGEDGLKRIPSGMVELYGHSQFRRDGVGISSIATMLGHASIALTLTYLATVRADAAALRRATKDE